MLPNSDQLRILQLISGLDIGGNSGGAEYHALQVAFLLNKAEFKPALFYLRHFHTSREQDWLDEIKQRSLPVSSPAESTGTLSFSRKHTFSRLWRFVTDFKPHIIHSHSERGDLMNALIHTLHPHHPVAMRTVHIDQQWITRPRLGSLMENFIFPLTFSVESAVSITIQQMLLKRPFRSEDQVTLCYNGIDASLFTRKPEMPPKISNQRPLIGIIGRLTRQKGHAVLIQALQIIHQAHPAHLLIVGEGPLRAQLEAQIRENALSKYVHFLGLRHDVLDILSCLDLFVLPSRWEGFPTAILEALSQNVPVIASDVAGSRELIKTGETGILISPDAPQQLAEAIKFMLENPAKAKNMAHQGKKFAAQFTTQNMTTCYEKVYQHLVYNCHGQKKKGQR